MVGAYFYADPHAWKPGEDWARCSKISHDDQSYYYIHVQLYYYMHLGHLFWLHLNDFNVLLREEKDTSLPTEFSLQT